MPRPESVCCSVETRAYPTARVGPGLGLVLAIGVPPVVLGWVGFAEDIPGGDELRGVAPEATLELAFTALATIEAGLKSVSENRRVGVAELLAV